MSGSLELVNRQRSHALNLAWLRQISDQALPACLAYPGLEAALLGQLDEIAVILVSDKKIARLHWDFMKIKGATDVITFQHGEIVISADTAAIQAKERNIPIEQEIALYLIHGLLHLNGHEDTSETGFLTMRKTQETILKKLLEEAR